MRKVIPFFFLLCGTACGAEHEQSKASPCTPSSGQICSLIGTGNAGFDGDEKPGAKTSLYLPVDVAIGPAEELYVIDWNNHRIRTLSSDGLVRTVAGSGLIGDGPSGPATGAAFNHPTGLAFDPEGRMIIAAWHNSKIKRLDLGTGMLEDLCGTGARAYVGDDGPATMAALDLPASVAVNSAGEFFVMDQANQVIRRVDASGMISRFAGRCIIGQCADGAEPTACAGSDKLTCLGDSDPTPCAKPCGTGFAGDGGDALDARIAQPVGQAADPAGRLVLDADGNVLFVDTGNHRVRRIEANTGTIETIAGTGTPGFAGDGGSARDAELFLPADLDVAPDGTVYVADMMNSCVRAISVEGVMSTVAGVCGQRGFAGDGGEAVDALLDRPYGIALDRSGRLLIADTYNHRLRAVGL